MVTSGSGGYTCSRCGGWVQDGYYHTCPPYSANTYQYYPQSYVPDERLYKLLEEIRDAIRELRKGEVECGS